MPYLIKGANVFTPKFLGKKGRPYSAGRTHQKLSNEPRYRSPFIGDLTRGTF